MRFATHHRDINKGKVNATHRPQEELNGSDYGQASVPNAEAPLPTKGHYTIRPARSLHGGLRLGNLR
jgi:hypothetical protein